MTIHVEPFRDEDAEAWDAFVADAWQGTLLHTRRYLSYHADRFVDRSLVVRDERGRLVGLLPAASTSADPATVVSHAGVTYGGFVHADELLGARMQEALTASAEHYREIGAQLLRYKAVPRVYRRRPAEDDLWALFTAGAQRVRCDLSSAIDLSDPGRWSERRRRGARRAEKAGVTVARESRESIAELWAIVEENLASRHQVRPTHTAAEIDLLAARFPEEIAIVCARSNGAVVAGVVLFRTPVTDHAQYIASAPEGRESGALDLVFAWCIESALRDGKRWFDFGHSTEEDGQRLNSGLYEFKSGFGGGGVVHEFYELSLR